MDHIQLDTEVAILQQSSLGIFVNNAAFLWPDLRESHVWAQAKFRSRLC